MSGPIIKTLNVIPDMCAAIPFIYHNNDGTIHKVHEYVRAQNRNQNAAIIVDISWLVATGTVLIIKFQNKEDHLAFTLQFSDIMYFGNKK